VNAVGGDGHGLNIVTASLGDKVVMSVQAGVAAAGHVAAGAAAVSTAPLKSGEWTQLLQLLWDGLHGDDVARWFHQGFVFSEREGVRFGLRCVLRGHPVAALSGHAIATQSSLQEGVLVPAVGQTYAA
jgi:hypothetical protein